MLNLTKRTFLAFLASIVLSIGVSKAVQSKTVEIIMAAPDWPPTRFMQEYFNSNFPQSGDTEIKLTLDFIPWDTFYTNVAASLTSGEEKYSMIVSDSQWLGAFIEGGYFQKLNKYIDADPELQAIFDDMHQGYKEGYTTYPYKSENYYGFPQFPDNYVNFYRTDIFCNPDENTAFRAKYGKKLPCTYADWEVTVWDDIFDINEFLTRKKGEMMAGKPLEDDMFGVTYQAGKAYDFSSMQINGFFWQFGGDIWREDQQPTAQAVGVVNSDINVEALTKYLDLLGTMHPSHRTGGMGIFEMQALYLEGKIASMINWVGLGAPVVDPSLSKVYDITGYARQPGTMQADGTISRWANLGGQPFVMTTWMTDDEIDASFKIIKWWLSFDTQIAAVKAGGQSCMKSIIYSDGYNALAPWNAAYVASMDWQKDVWHIPEFFELLTQQQEEFDKAITGQQDAKTTLDNIAEFQQELLEEVGRIE
ncbi:MAG: ABC transporter [Candidatus Marinimicrobia bacterium]|nr:ABC transporter [Candidatus Neomarinimicrobiota bacterium]